MKIHSKCLITNQFLFITFLNIKIWVIKIVDDDKESGGERINNADSLRCLSLNSNKNGLKCAHDGFLRQSNCWTWVFEHVLSMITIWKASVEDNISVSGCSLRSYSEYDIGPEWCNETDVSHWITEFLFWGFVSVARLTCFLYLSFCTSISSLQSFASGSLLALWSRNQKLYKQVMRNPEPLHSIPIGNWEETTLMAGAPAIFTAWPSNFNTAVSLLLMLCHI